VIVLDASVVLEVLLQTRAGRDLTPRLFDPRESLHVPHLLDLEVAQVLRRFVMARQLDAERAAQALADLADLPLARYPQDLFLSRIWELRSNLTAYDAVYVALAEALGAPLLTRDRRLAKAPHRARLELV
jgi:predicted nucleic acid-binding protein